jgi:parallel beta-helix repeat protein
MGLKLRIGLLRKTVSGILLFLLLISIITFTFNIQPAKAESGVITINADGSVSPSTAPISSLDNFTYTLTGNIINGSIVVKRSNIIINGAGYTVQGNGSGTGVDLTGISNVTIENTEIKVFYYGIYLSSSSHNSISGNNITKNSGDGIYLYGSSNNVTGNNITKNNCYGIELEFSSYNTVSGNSITNNLAGIGFYCSSYNTISGNSITNIASGIDLYSSSYNTISGNSVTANYWGGIELYSSSYNTVSGNMFTNDGLYVFDSYGNDVEGNLVNGKPLVYLEGKTGVTVNNAGQVILVDCSGIQVENLNLSSATVGVELWLTNGSRITGNNVTNNCYGIELEFSSNNFIYHNNFINNTCQAYSVDSPNTWDNGYPSGGNYWSDYQTRYPNAAEIDSSGIWNTPYVIYADNTDRYPLMSPYSVVTTSTTSSTSTTSTSTTSTTTTTSTSTTSTSSSSTSTSSTSTTTSSTTSTIPTTTSTTTSSTTSSSTTTVIPEFPAMLYVSMMMIALTPLILVLRRKLNGHL